MVNNTNPFEQNELRVYEDENFIANLTSATESFCSMKADTDKEKASLFKAMNNPDKRLSEMINNTIAVKDLYCEVVDVINKDTGITEKCPRIVLIDDKNISYQCVSRGIYSAFKKLILIYGQPTWEKPIKLKVRQIENGNKRLLTLDPA